jgi:molybdopterin molybdotransferase
MLTIGEAIAGVMRDVAPLERETVPLPASFGRVLAEDVAARMDSPPFANSAMDGYAVRAEDLTEALTEVPVRLPVMGESSAGGAQVPVCPAGVAVRIFTGAALPQGADAVVLQEDVTREGDLARFTEAAKPGQNVRQQGEDARAGDPLLRRGGRVTAGELGLLASQGIAEVAVVRRPRVAVLSSGDELRRIDDPERPGSIINSNAYMLEAMLRDVGAIPEVLPIVRDDLGALTAALTAALQDNDLVITSGGVSVGDHDLMRPAFAAAGVEMAFWKVAIKPGKPFAYGCRPDGKRVVGLPGNPVSAFVTFEVLVRPLLRALLGDATPHRGLLRATLASTVKQTRGRDELLRGRLVQDASCAPGVAFVPVPRRGSGALPALAGVDALALIPAGIGDVPAGTSVDCLPLFDAPGRGTSPFGEMG